MPSLEISMPKTDPATRAKLAEALTKVFADSTRFGAEIFGIRFNEYEPNQTASGGILCDGHSGKPYLHFLLYIPRIDRTTKQKLVEGFSQAFTTVIGHDDWLPVIHIDEHPYDNVGVEGELLSDAYDECKNQKFYYDLGE